MVKVAAPGHVQFAQSLNEVPVGVGAGDVDELFDELQEYCDILLGRKEAPINSPYLQLQEIATAYYARAQEIDMLLHAAERKGDILRGSPLYRFRTGELEAFISMASKVANLGSRRLTQEALLTEQRLDAGR